jgi:hypothetical protein
LQLDKQPVHSSGELSGASLAQLCADVAARLDVIQRALADGQTLPAWGDPDSCQHCPMDGVCRRGAWAADDTGVNDDSGRAL